MAVFPAAATWKSSQISTKKSQKLQQTYTTNQTRVHQTHRNEKGDIAVFTHQSCIVIDCP